MSIILCNLKQMTVFTLLSNLCHTRDSATEMFAVKLNLNSNFTRQLPFEFYYDTFFVV